MNSPKQYRTILTIAGSDPSGGAGIQADIKTFSALGCYGMSVITCLTAQNTQSVSSVHKIPSDFVLDQLHSVANDIHIDAIKIGMLHNVDTIKLIATALKEYKFNNVVLDPVMFAKGGDRLLQEDAIESLKRELFPLARIVTPNLKEAEYLINHKIQESQQAENAASELSLQYNIAVVIKGLGHVNGKSDDCLCIPSGKNSNQISWLTQNRIDTLNVHGAGCTFSSAIAAFLALRNNLKEAVHLAKNFTSNAIISGANFKLGKGHGPVGHFYEMWKN